MREEERDEGQEEASNGVPLPQQAVPDLLPFQANFLFLTFSNTFLFNVHRSRAFTPVMEATPGFQHSQHCLDLCVCTEVVCYQQQSGGNWEDAGGWAGSTHTAHTIIQHPQESDKVSLS